MEYPSRFTQPVEGLSRCRCGADAVITLSGADAVPTPMRCFGESPCDDSRTKSGRVHRLPAPPSHFITWRFCKPSGEGASALRIITWRFAKGCGTKGQAEPGPAGRPGRAGAGRQAGPAGAGPELDDRYGAEVQ